MFGKKPLRNYLKITFGESAFIVLGHKYLLCSLDSSTLPLSFFLLIFTFRLFPPPPSSIAVTSKIPSSVRLNSTHIRISPFTLGDLCVNELMYALFLFWF